MEEEVKSTDKSTDKRLENLKPAWKEGDPSPNPSGRPKGLRNYATVYAEAMMILADKNATTPEKLEAEMVANAAVLARKGDYRFYKDFMDRLHGQATQKNETTLILPNIELSEDIAKKYGITRSTEANS